MKCHLATSQLGIFIFRQRKHPLALPKMVSITGIYVLCMVSIALSKVYVIKLLHSDKLHSGRLQINSSVFCLWKLSIVERSARPLIF